jgi:hypothetical protein
MDKPLPNLAALLMYLGDFRGPLHIEAYSPDFVKCFRLKDRRLHVYQGSAFPVLLTGPEHILANHALAEILQSTCGASIQGTPVDVMDVTSGNVLANYQDIKPYEEITPQTISGLDSSGSRAWHFERSHLFVTRPVAVAIFEAGFGGMIVSRGFEEFAGV